ncbi:hypothetical protein D3C71_1814130 [compost metagenome]
MDIATKNGLLKFCKVNPTTTSCSFFAGTAFSVTKGANVSSDVSEGSVILLEEHAVSVTQATAININDTTLILFILDYPLFYGCRNK